MSKAIQSQEGLRDLQTGIEQFGRFTGGAHSFHTSLREMEIVSFKLYLAGRSPNSVRALANLEALCRQHLPGHYHIDVIDVLKEPQRALQEGIRVTPTLVRVAPGPVRQIVGNLSETSKVLLALDLPCTPPAAPVTPIQV